jgi:hypothetical protein
VRLSFSKYDSATMLAGEQEPGVLRPETVMRADGLIFGTIHPRTTGGYVVYIVVRRDPDPPAILPFQWLRMRREYRTESGARADIRARWTWLRRHFPLYRIPTWN